MGIWASRLAMWDISAALKPNGYYWTTMRD